jgi:hypothetical protein
VRAFARALEPAEGPGAVRLADGALVCEPDRLAREADLAPTLARVLLFAFEEAGLAERGPDCTLEATVLFNQAPERSCPGWPMPASGPWPANSSPSWAPAWTARLRTGPATSTGTPGTTRAGSIRS